MIALPADHVLAGVLLRRHEAPAAHRPAQGGARCVGRPDQHIGRGRPSAGGGDKEQLGVQHYWILDPERRTLRVHRWTETGYLGVLEAGRPRTVRAEPFEAFELNLADLFDDA